jgi:ACS family pantothenate transporter-like MFS transporter
MVKFLTLHQQAAVYKTLEGHHGLAGWRWLYIVCGVRHYSSHRFILDSLTSKPHKTNAWFLTKEDCELGIERVEKAGKAPPVKITRATFKRIFSRWSKYAPE